MELKRPRSTTVLAECELGVVPEALSKPPYEPLREAFLKHIAYKTVFLLAVASAGRTSELYARSGTGSQVPVVKTSGLWCHSLF